MLELPFALVLSQVLVSFESAIKVFSTVVLSWRSSAVVAADEIFLVQFVAVVTAVGRSRRIMNGDHLSCSVLI